MIRIAGFSGEIPRLIPRLLNDNYAQVAQNTKLENGALTPIRRGRFVHQMPFDCKTIYKNGDEWLGWEKFVRVVPAPIAENRLYVTGDGKPKIIANGVTYDLAVQFPANKLTISLVSGTPDPELSSTVLYTYTWVTSLDEESEPAPLSNELLWSPGLDVRLTGFTAPPVGRGINRMRIYRSQTSATGVTTLFFIKEREATAADFVDVVADNPINEPIRSTDYNAPPDDLQGLTALPNGMMAGFVGKKLYFCEPYIPHAWPEKYILTCDYEIVGLGVFGSAVAIMTTGNPYVASGTLPENMTMERLRVNLPCLTAQSIVDLGYSVAYASTEGLVTISQSGAVVASKELMTTDQWKQMGPESFVSGQYSGRYMVSYSFMDSGSVERRGTLIFDLTGSQPFLSRAADDADAMFFEIGTGVLYLLRNNRDIFEWDAISEPYGEQYWRSKRFVIPSLTNFGCILVDGEDVTTTLQAKESAARNAAARARNRALIETDKTGGALADAALGIVTFAGSLLEPVDDTDPRFSVAIYADGKLRHTVYELNKIHRLPAGFLATTWEIEVRGNQQVTAITLAFSPEEIAGG
ncbi:TPA: hypothetical protein SMF87_004590 [Serratia marcescens]|nr:hypothetical protein [Serratia marcescens]